MAEKFDHVDDNFSAMDERIDRLELGQAEMKSEMKSIHEVGLANLELLEGKINNSKSGLEMLKDYMKDKFEYTNKSLGHWFREMGRQKHYYVYDRVIIECRKATKRELQYGLIFSSLSLLHKHKNLRSYSLSNEGKWRANHLPLPQVRHIF